MIAKFIRSVMSSSEKITEMQQELIEARHLKVELNKSRCVSEYTQDGICSSANENWLNELGYNLAEVINQKHSKFIELSYSNSPEYYNFWQKISQGQSHAGEYPLLNSKGEVVWMRGEFLPLRDVDGNVYKVVSYLSAVTGDKLKTRSNEIEFSRIKSAINSSSAAVMTIDRDFIVTYVNEATK
ncbi:MAG: PAS domain-containing protein, partial [Nitrosomonadales bacterium]|nr:PAS domain-containing protein [Nitrosomonadales bacterium]